VWSPTAVLIHHVSCLCIAEHICMVVHAVRKFGCARVDQTGHLKRIHSFRDLMAVCARYLGTTLLTRNEVERVEPNFG
jgi:hypothetical protein